MQRTLNLKPFFPLLEELYNKLQLEQLLFSHVRLGETYVIEAGRITTIILESTRDIKSKELEYIQNDTTIIE